MHPRREYDKVASEALVGGQASAGPAPAEDGHGATRHSVRTHREQGGDKNPRRASSERDPGDRETEERAPPNGPTRLTQAVDEGGKGMGEPPLSSASPWRPETNRDGTPGNTNERPPQEGGTRTQMRDPSDLLERERPMEEGRRRGAPLNGRLRLTRATAKGGKGEGEPPPRSARPRSAARERGGTPDRTSRGTPREGGHLTRKGTPSARMEHGAPRRTDGDEGTPRTAARA